jgi:primosomal protein N'
VIRNGKSLRVVDFGLGIVSIFSNLRSFFPGLRFFGITAEEVKKREKK